MIPRREKIIRDPVHDVIAFRIDQDDDALLFRLLNTPEFQRLRRVRQLGFAHLAYPGADHSRHSHCLGTLQTARQMLTHLGRDYAIEPRDRTACLAAALLHDLGHGPFSHVFERVNGQAHELMSQRLILDPDAEVNRLLCEHDPELPRRIVDLMRCEPARSFYSDVLCSQLDADRFDYLLRDNLMTGSRYGRYDLSWLLHALMVGDGGARLAVSFKGVSAVEAYLQARYHMYRNVYFHKVVRSAEGMVRLALQRARRLAVQGRLPWPGREDAVSRALLGQQLRVEEFIHLDDVSLLHCFKVWMSCEDAVLARLCHGLLYRRVYKTIDLSDQPPDRSRELVARAQQAVEQAGGDSAYDLFYDEPADTPYETYDPEQGGPTNEIMVCRPDGTLVEFASISPMSRTLNRQLMFRRLHVAEAWVETVRRAVERIG